MKHVFTIDVMFSLSIPVKVKACNYVDALDIAETEAAEQFRDLLDKGLLGASDFDCEAQTP